MTTEDRAQLAHLAEDLLLRGAASCKLGEGKCLAGELVEGSRLVGMGEGYVAAARALIQHIREA